MAVILDDEHLESLRCSKCHKYLSVFPVKNHPSRDVTCGRCSGHDDVEGGVRSALYELIAERHLFRCVNRYEGCRRLLRAYETEEHERGCAGRAFDCPKCEGRAGACALELIWHYRLRHPGSYLKRNRFDWRPPGDDAMLYVRDDEVFVVSVGFEPGTNALRLRAATLTGADVALRFFVVGEGSCACGGDGSTVGVAPGKPVEVVFTVEASRPAGPYVVPSSGDVRGKTVHRPTKPAKKSLRNLGTVGDVVNRNNVWIDFGCSNCRKLMGFSMFKGHDARHEAVPPEIMNKILQLE